MSAVATDTWTAEPHGSTLHGFLLLGFITTLWNGEQKTLESNIVMLSMSLGQKYFHLIDMKLEVYKEFMISWLFHLRICTINTLTFWLPPSKI